MGSLPRVDVDDPRARCFYARACPWFGGCLGLPSAYVERHGWEVASLSPAAALAHPPDADLDLSLRPTPPMNRAIAPRPRRLRTAEATPLAGLEPAPGVDSGSRWLSLLAGPDGDPLCATSLWTLDTVIHGHRIIRFRFTLANHDRYDLLLEPRRRQARRHGQTAGFNLTLVAAGRTVPQPGIMNRLLFALLAIVRRNDDGRLRLD